MKNTTIIVIPLSRSLRVVSHGKRVWRGNLCSVKSKIEVELLKNFCGERKHMNKVVVDMRFPAQAVKRASLTTLLAPFLRSIRKTITGVSLNHMLSNAYHPSQRKARDYGVESRTNSSLQIEI